MWPGEHELKHLANLGDVRRDAIVDVASREFIDWGLERASMNRIIAGAGISKGSMYHYFESKADLFAVAVVTAAERVAASIGPPPSGFGSVAAFRVAFRRWYETLLVHLAEHRDDDRLLDALRVAASTPHPPDAVQRCAAILRASYDPLYEELSSMGALRTDIPIGILAGITERSTIAIDRWFIDEIREDPDRVGPLADIGTDLFLRLVSPASDS